MYSLLQIIYRLIIDRMLKSLFNSSYYINITIYEIHLVNKCS